MHKDFADWYRVVALQPEDAVLQKRWQGVEACAKALTSDQALEVVRLFFGLPPKRAVALDEFREHFKAVDTAFPMRANEAELRVLAGAVVAEALRSAPESVGYSIALAVQCGDFRGKRSGNRLGELVVRAREFLLERSAALRAETVPPLRRLEIDPAAAAKRIDEAIAANAANTLGTSLKQTIQALIEAVESSGRVLEAFVQNQRLHREENDILWWMLGGYSRDLKKPMAEIPLGGACLVAGKELSDMIRVLPGPVAAPAFLDRVLHGLAPDGEHSSVTLIQAVKMLPEEAKQQWPAVAGVQVVDDICPVVAAVARARETADSKVWGGATERATRLRLSEKLPPLRLAHQVFEEFLLLRALNMEK